MEITLNGSTTVIHRPRLSYAQAVGLAGFEYGPDYVVIVTVNGSTSTTLHEGDAVAFLVSDTVVVTVSA